MPRQLVCQKGHDDWVTDKRGNRSCRICRNIRNRKRKRVRKTQPKWSEFKRMGDRGPREETFTREQLLTARGYEI